MKILLVDDEKDIVSTLAERLALRGIEAAWVTSGEEALQILETEKFDLAILDVKMPVMNGLELQKKMNERHKDLKCLFLTSRGAEEALEPGAYLAGKENYLSKPIKIDVLIKKMEEALKQ
ncbi:MAG: response regulator [Thermodesulfobacteriota bacterium]|nr:response regulator [Thermodesulfobacteriota bacterium]